jgi:hypothetical protein
MKDIRQIYKSGRALFNTKEEGTLKVWEMGAETVPLAMPMKYDLVCNAQNQPHNTHTHLMHNQGVL